MGAKIIKSSLNQIRPYLAKWLPSIKKFFQNHIRPHLPEWLPFLPLPENAPELKDITAEELQEICKLISPSLSHCWRITRPHSYNSNMPAIRDKLTNAFLYNDWDIQGNIEDYHWQDFNITDLQKAKEKIIELGLSENIKLELNKYPGDNSEDFHKIEIKNLNIKGNFKTELNHIHEIEFTNNTFQGHTAIGVIGTHQCLKCTFRNNHFMQIFSHSTFNVNFINFTDNKFFQLHLDFAPPIMRLCPDGKDYENDNDYNEAIKHIVSNFTFVESRLRFTKNKALILSINDHKHLATPYKNNAPPFKTIEFLGGNAFDYLKIETHHSELNSDNSPNIRADANRIFFDVSDEISPLAGTGNGAYSTGGFDSQAKEHQLSYLEFFSLLKRDAAKQHTPVLEDIYAKKIRYFSRFLVSRRQDKFIFHWGNWISDGGESWTKPLKWFVSLQFIFSCIAWLSACWSEFPVSFGALLFEFLNPLSGLPSLDSSKIPTWTAFLLLSHKLVAAVTIYEAVKALRRFSK